MMLDALGNSLLVATIATLIATIIGTMVALSLVRGNFPGKRVLDSVLFLPVVIPEITQAISLLIFFNVIFDLCNGLSRPTGGCALTPASGRSSSGTWPSTSPTWRLSCARGWPT